MNNTITIILNSSGSVADVRKDFTLYQGQYQSKLLDVLVPSEMLAPIFVVKNYIGQMNMPTQPTDADLLVFVESMTTPSREPQQGDVVEFYNSTDETYWLYTFNNGEWESTEVNGFGTTNNPDGTSVKIGLRATQRNGILYESKSYFMRYLKTIKIDEVEYALYERQLPKEFTTFAGQGVNAPTLVCNVVNIDNDEVTSLITTQTCALDVMPSTALDKDETIEASDLERIEADINTLSGNMDLKQDKEDIRLATQSKTVVGAINGLNNESHINTQNIANNTQDIVDLSQRVANIEQLQSSGGDTFVGTMRGSTLPTQTQLNDFVYTKLGREPKGNDIITFILEVTGGTDKNYQYKYSGGTQTWSEWEIPATEPASNENMGIVKGSYNSTLASTRKTQVNIVGGEIEDIYITDNNGIQRELHDYINDNRDDIDNMISGQQQVGRAIRADKDSSGNTFENTYLTQNAGVSKQQMKDYALPREFNDIYYLGQNVFQDTKPSTTISYSQTISGVGTYELLRAELQTTASFELSYKNSYQNVFYISSNQDVVCQFRLDTSYGSNILMNTELSNRMVMTANNVYRVQFNDNFNELSDAVSFDNGSPTISQVLSVVSTDSVQKTFTVWSNSTNLSTFNLNTNNYSIKLGQGYLGEIPAITLEGTLNNNIATFEVWEDLENNTIVKFTLSCIGLDSTTNLQLVDAQTSEEFYLITPYNEGQVGAVVDRPSVADFSQTKVTTNGNVTTITFLALVNKIEGYGTKLIVNEDDLGKIKDAFDVYKGSLSKASYTNQEIYNLEDGIYTFNPAITYTALGDYTDMVGNSTKGALILVSSLSSGVYTFKFVRIFYPYSFQSDILRVMSGNYEMDIYKVEQDLITRFNRKEDKTNKVTSLSSSSTDAQYPSAKCVYDLVGDVETLLTALNSGQGV